MEVEEALRKEIILQHEKESLDGALQALIETRLRLDEYYKNHRNCLEKAKNIVHLVTDTEVLLRYAVDADGIPVDTTLRELKLLIKELEAL